MFQLSVIVVLVASMFVGRTSPLMQNEEHESKVFIANITQSTDTLSNNNGKKMDLSIKATVVKKDLDLRTMNESNNSTLMNLTNANVSTPINENNRDKEKLNNEKQMCNSKTEQADMLHCNVIPRDNDDDESLNTTEPTTHNATTANNEIKSSTKSQVPEVPHKKEENGTDIEIVLLNNTQTTNQVPYDITLPDINHTINTNSSDVSSTNLKDSSTNETSPLPVKKAATSVSSENIAEVAKSVSRNNSKHMPSGIIALVTAISFAVAIALVYIGMIVWRRYIEYRYGHRELLVNELEFDTNDLRHFEL
ncbi:GATA zinc finger domain-containing protein 14 isoform X3 [Frieseomelitta varia]|uniref:GATA zinc finger domain-containing protein 14 isoform X3 n=1 Tax=Frieseomelitta varia TaxID=561572 RepID=UPI001CB6A463|nr:GATA zinc finger domain-containing protein 14 isoform X3 [Frieseomelitta varia]